MLVDYVCDVVFDCDVVVVLVGVVWIKCGCVQDVLGVGDYVGLVCVVVYGDFGCDGVGGVGVDFVYVCWLCVVVLYYCVGVDCCGCVYG